jgi:type IV secretion system protein VirB10
MSVFRRWRRAAARGSHEESAPVEESAEELREAVRDSVPGERGFATVNRPPSLQSRLSNMLAAGLMSTLAIGFLGWYYIHAMASRKAAATASQSAPKDKAQGEMALPPLGRIDPPKPPAATPKAIEQALGPAPEEPPKLDTGQPPLGAAPGPYNAYSAPQPPAKTPAQLALERRLAGPVFTTPSALAVSPATSAAASTQDGTPHAMPVSAQQTESGQKQIGDIASLLHPTVTSAEQARVLPTQRLLLPKGAFLDCTLETAIDSTLPGMTTCVLATDTFSVDGSVVLLERGTKLVGETRGQVQQGSSRIFVLWTEARTPTGVIVPLASPGTDELGRSGLAGQVDRHFWDRFGAAILVSVIEGGVQAAVQSRNNGGTVIYNPTTTTDVTTEVLKSTISIPPTVTKANGDRIQVFVARDLDFRSVYELRAR